MKCQLAEIPDDGAALGGWLEPLLVSLELGEAVTELAVLAEHRWGAAPAAAAAPALEAILGAQRDKVLQRGLSELEPQQLRQLLSSPAALLELQELVLLEGGGYWQRLLETDEVARSKPSIAPPPQSGKRRGWRIPATLAVLAAAALFMIWSRPTATWGWLSDDALATAAPGEYLRQLAVGGEAWFAQRPESQRNVKQRISELREGCQRLIEARHEPLAPEDAGWLRERCLAWRDKLDAAMAALTTEDPLTVRGEVDAIIRGATGMLRERAAALDA